MAQEIQPPIAPTDASSIPQQVDPQWRVKPEPAAMATGGMVPTRAPRLPREVEYAPMNPHNFTNDADMTTRQIEDASRAAARAHAGGMFDPDKDVLEEGMKLLLSGAMLGAANNIPERKFDPDVEPGARKREYPSSVKIFKHKF